MSCVCVCVCVFVCVCVCVCVHDQWQSTGKQRIIVITIIQSKICTCTTSRVFALSLTHTECSAWESKRRGMQRTCGSLLCLLKAFKLPSFFWSHIRASWSRAVLCVVCTRVENATFVMHPSFTGTHTQKHTFIRVDDDENVMSGYVSTCVSRTQLHFYNHVCFSFWRHKSSHFHICIYVCVILTHHDRNFSSIVCTSVVVTIPRRRK